MKKVKENVNNQNNDLTCDVTLIFLKKKLKYLFF